MPSVVQRIHSMGHLLHDFTSFQPTQTSCVNRSNKKQCINNKPAHKYIYKLLQLFTLMTTRF